MVIARQAEVRVRAALRARLEARRGEIEEAALTRVNTIADPTEAADPAYMDGLRAAVEAAIDYGLEALGREEEWAPPAPVLLFAQARMAARNDVSLDTVFRRYFAGYSLLAAYMIEEAENSDLLREVGLQDLLRGQAATFDRLIEAISEEYVREAGRRFESSEQRRVERIRRLLAGELLDTTKIAYNFNAHHLGIVVIDGNHNQALRDLAGALDRRLLLVHPDEGTAWAWLGGRAPLDPSEVESLLDRLAPTTHGSIALGEVGVGIGGWRLTHRQALAALPIAKRQRRSVVRYENVALLASALQDDLLTTSLRQAYLAPLQDRRGGEVSQRTLRAYFDAGRSVASAAVALGVSRQTVGNRLRQIEKRLGRTVDSCLPELEIALQLDGRRVSKPLPERKAR